MIRFCPHCQTERQLTEIFCAGQVNDKLCGWDLTIEPIHESGWRPSPPISSSIDTPAIIPDLNHDQPRKCINRTLDGRR